MKTNGAGNEAYWGDVKLSRKELNLINASPTLRSQLHDYRADASAGLMRLMSMGPADGGTHFDQRGIVFAKGHGAHASQSPGYLAHEIGHYANHPNDPGFAAGHAVSPRDPQARNQWALGWMHAEGAAVYNNGKVKQEIAQNTAKSNAPATSIRMTIPPGTGGEFNNQHAADVKAGKSEEQDRNHMIAVGMGWYATATSSGANDSYFHLYGRNSLAAPPEKGAAASVKFTADDNGNIASMTKCRGAGNVRRQPFPEGKIQSSTMQDSSGKVLVSTTYTYDRDGGHPPTLRITMDTCCSTIVSTRTGPAKS